MDFKQTKTYENLVNAYKGELYGVAMYQNLSQTMQNKNKSDLRDIFHRLANEEKAHADALKKFIPAEGFDFNLPPKELAKIMIADYSNKASIEEFIAGEQKAGNEIYPLFAQIAQQEGYEDIAKTFTALASVELEHSNRLAAQLEQF